MKTADGRRRPLSTAAMLLAALFTTTGLSGAAAPAENPSLTRVEVTADRYVAMAFYPATFGWWATWSANATDAKNRSLDQCNLLKSEGTYNCVSAGPARNGYLAVAVSEKNGPWGWAASTSATVAGQNALYYCKYYGGGDACHVIFNRHSSEK